MSGDEMSPNGTQSTGAHYVWYIKHPDTLAGVFLFIENNVWSLRRVATKLETGIVLSE